MMRRRSITSPNYITVNICSSLTPTTKSSTVRTPNKTPIRSTIKKTTTPSLNTRSQSTIRTPSNQLSRTQTPTTTATRSQSAIKATTATKNLQQTPNTIRSQTPTISRIQHHYQNENKQPTTEPSRKLKYKYKANKINDKQSLNNTTPYKTPSPAPYYLRRQNRSSIFSTYTMSDSKIERNLAPTTTTATTISTTIATSTTKQQLKRSIQDDYKDSSNSSRNENSVSVAIRVRPLNSKERNPENANLPIIVNSENNTIKVKDKNSESYLEFSFDHCFNSTKPSSPDYVSQEKVYLSIGKPLFEKIFNGNNVCVFCYGQTGSGKSHTIMGTNDNNGLIPRFAREFFNQTKNHEKKLVIEASYFEIYNEKIHDLLIDIKNLDEKQPLKIREKPSGSPYVENLSLHMISSIEDLFNILIKGNKNKAVASTIMNDRSSRSHTIFNLNVYEQKPTKNEENSAKKKTCIQLLSKINFIDLAGSERASVIGSTGDRLKEGNLINKSLLTLGKVITLLSENSSSSSTNHQQQQHIPYRESHLTYLLKDCLGGNSYTCMIATISPSVENLEESLSTLRYASKARRIVNKIKQNRIVDNVDTEQMELEFENKLNKINEIIKTDLENFKEIVFSLQSNRFQFTNKVHELFSDLLDYEDQ